METLITFTGQSLTAACQAASRPDKFPAEEDTVNKHYCGTGTSGSYWYLMVLVPHGPTGSSWSYRYLMVLVPPCWKKQHRLARKHNIW